ncbi:MAG: ImmA/IrrE family metallo-endopeptidase [Pseudomonadota bacterium]
MFGERLKLARKKSGLSLRDLAGQLDPPVSAQAISLYERGVNAPSSGVLMGLCEALDCSLDFLLAGQVRSLDNLEFRKKAASTAKDRAKIEAMVIESLESYLDVESILDLPDPQDPFAGLRRDVDSPADIEKLAAELREAWTLGNDSIPSMVGLLEDHGVRIVQADLPERVSGLTCQVRRGGDQAPLFVIVVSSRANVERRRFTLAHELAHRVIAEVAIDGMAPEKAMDLFAGAFLVPADHLRAEVGDLRRRISYQEIKRLKHLYGVSASSMLVRLKQVGILPESAVAQAFKTWARGWRTAEPEPIGEREGVAAFEKPRRFERLAYRALAEQLISPARAAELLQRPLGVVEQELQGPAPP